MTSKLQVATSEDLEALAEIFLTAYAGDVVQGNLFLNVPWEAQIKFGADLLKQDFGKPGVKDLVMVDTETG